MKCSKENIGCRRFQRVLHGRRMEVVGTIPDNYEENDIPWRAEKVWELKILSVKTSKLRIESFGKPVTI